MGLKEIRKNIVKNFEERKEKISEESKIVDEIRTEIKIADSYFKSKNYTMSFFMFFKALKMMCVFYLTKQHGKIDELSDLDALFFVSKKDGFPFNEKVARNFLNKFDLVLSRKELEKNDCIEIQRVVKDMREKIGI
ncbi:MAG: hypothetical protein OH319_00600 [Candidatus Parvarchaeota archaeon]|nr:hypothetical protein [Candidatus Jingweiarchaeum tengchongense]MCW1298357.1 hypothetical protein [Candidatus Jingweiarchaeum tengchongense]MCW1300341.1 hypothetical protein [Candidatus Jingweiarchaeum tengchongense]MCW1304862.1 hypothetical protein [Candidatus Jingweiarchaeum tengchongense]MCW1305837.1 hypothetical protein [Candidatus Jingweiarchaeum tengchongense]